VIQIRGTSGSGKTWVMREVMAAMGDILWSHISPYDIPKISRYVEGRKKPLWYAIGDLAVLGHYEAACGGCDNIGSARQVYEVIQEVLPQCKNILCEGLLLSEDVKWTSQLDDVHVLYLTTPVEQCIAQIKRRREEAGNTKPLNEANTRNRVAVIERSRIKLLALGVDCRRVSARQAPGTILKLLQLHA
jgi:hypothetical protein